MSRDLDPRLQQIIENAGLAARDKSAPEFSFPRVESRSAQRSFGEGLSWSFQENQVLNDFSRESSSYEVSNETVAAARTTSRLSLAPWSTQHRQEREQNSATNADNHFRFTQNLRQGLPVGREISMTNMTQGESVLDQLAANMLLQRPMPQPSPDLTSTSHGLCGNRISQLQPQIQQVTPPFNLSGYVPTPNTQKDSSLSSPSQFANSSPTARVSLRRLANRKRLPPKQLGEDHEVEEYTPPFETPQRRQSMARTENVMQSTPQALTSGHAPPMAKGIQLISPYELPDRFRQVFPYELFNAVQSRCFATVYKTNDNVVVSAPTGCGKTVILELAICKLVASHDSGEFKIIYQAPTRSLCSERMRDWQKKFSHLNLPCAELTGDTSQYEMNKVRNASIIVTTPEKWDSITRKWQDHFKLLQMVKLFLIDEVHILKESRGATLEAVVSRMKYSGAKVRFIALSATVPNSEDIAIWLGRDPTTTHLPAHREIFGEDFRPVKLQKHVYGFDGLMNDFAFDKVLDGKLPGLIQKHTVKKPIMVFCFTRKSCENTAAILAEWWTRQKAVHCAWPAPTERTVVINKELQELVGCGVAFHHAGLDGQDRNAIESAFLKGNISVICCTSTLAVGINLPCHLVVLKGTVGFQDGGLGEYPDLEVMQMLGRAGRPQFDDSAVAIIMTRLDKVQRYTKMVSGQEILESTLHLNLIEHLNSEIGLGTIYSVETAWKWLSGTFLSVRMSQNPDYYKLEGIPSSRDVDETLRLVCERDVKLLQENRLVADEKRFMCTEYGHAMSRYMVQFDTMRLLLSLPRGSKTEQILQLICQASEFKGLRMKPNERTVLREFNKSPLIKYPIKENISTTPQKISLIIQVQLGGIDLPTNKEFLSIRRQFLVDKGVIFERVQRLIRCVIDCKSVDCDGTATRHALDLARSLSAEYWENSNLQLRQIPQVGPVTSRKLVTHNVNSIEELADLDTAHIERIMSRNPPFGRKMLDSILGFPRLTIVTEVAGRAASKPGENPKAMVKVKLGYTNAKTPVWNGKKPSLTFMADRSDGTLIHFWRGNIEKLDKGHEVKFIAELLSPNEEIKCYVACDEIVGTSRYGLLKPNIPASAFPVKDISKQPKRQTQFTDQDDSPGMEDEFGDNDFEDQELLEAAIQADAALSEYYSDDFADVDDLIGTHDSVTDKRDELSDSAAEPVRMENGKWECNHPCRGGHALKNGLLCKHKCCHDGLDKPRKAKRKDATSSQVTKSTKPTNKSREGKQMGKKVSKKSKGQLTLNIGKRGLQVQGADLEMIDLADEVPPPSYEKLYNPDCHNEKSVRLPKQKPKFSYASGQHPIFPLLNKGESNNDSFNFENQSQEDDFPSPSALLNVEGDAGYPFFNSMTDAAPVPTNLSGTVEATTPVFDNSIEPRTPEPGITSSFENGIFDFSAFSDHPCAQDIFSSPLMESSLKRPPPPTPELPEAKCRRVEHKQTANREETASQSEVKALRQEDAQQRSTPAWVDEFDQAFIDDLKGIVEFMD